jgi:hypothetical protein
MILILSRKVGGLCLSFVYRKQVVKLGARVSGMQQPGDMKDHLKKGMKTSPFLRIIMNLCVWI